MGEERERGKEGGKEVHRYFLEPIKSWTTDLERGKYQDVQESRSGGDTIFQILPLNEASATIFSPCI
jgi:hypothetical protein